MHVIERERERERDNVVDGSRTKNDFTRSSLDDITIMRVETIILQRMTGYITGCILSVNLAHLRNNLWITCIQ